MSASPRPRAGKPSFWVFDGYLMAERETTAWNVVKALQTPANKGWRVFDGYLMGRGFASCQSPQMSLDKMTANQPGFVKRAWTKSGRAVAKPRISKGFLLTRRGSNQAARVRWIVQ